MDRKSTLGVILAMGLLFLWVVINRPSQEELNALKAKQDSIAAMEDNKVTAAPEEILQSEDQNISNLSDSARVSLNANKFGVFSPASIGKEQLISIENDEIIATFSSKGGSIRDIEFKKHNKILEDEDKNELEIPLKLMNHEKNQFDYNITLNDNRVINTGDLFFKSETIGNQVIFTANTSNGGKFVQTYTLGEDFEIDYKVELVDLGQVINSAEGLHLNWVNYLNKLEKNDNFERRYSSVYYKEVEESPDHCNCAKSDTDDLDGKPVKWVSHVNQFFNSSLIADGTFKGHEMATEHLGKDAEELKVASSHISFDLDNSSNQVIDLTFFIGPNEFEKLHAIGHGLHNIIPYGSNIFGTINQWVIRPLFNFLYKIVGSYGWAIILLTLIVKIAVFPLTYRALKSSSKMQALKPEMEKLKDKYKDDSQKIQMETMKLYSEFGVNPVGGCFPMLLQMPIWFAMFRFFPADVDFRQKSFLWATDLSSYDVFVNLPFEVPIIGAHISLFALLWAITSVIYTYYNMQMMNTTQMSDQMKPMLYMQYAMPLMFFFAFNNYSSGLSCYFFFSNLINIAQTIVTKNFIIDNDKIREQLEKNKANPKKKKKGGFRDRLQEALKEQQKIAEQKQKDIDQKRGKKKRT